MKKIAREWFDKAMADAKTAEREGQVQQDPNWDAVCFHAQQAVEKALKALMQEKKRNAFIEDLLAATSPDYLNSIQEARSDYQAGRISDHKDLFGDEL